ncbi:MAG: hypothetical protein ACR2RB_03965 [Gammaproteobacteria bacterium]
MKRQQLVTIACSLLLAGCYNARDLPRTVVWTADDRRPIAEPKEETEGQWLLWDGADKMVFLPGRQFFNFGRFSRAIGTWIGVAGPLEAPNVNAVDEVPDSTWFTNRHFFSRLSPDALVRGALTTQAPRGPWTVTGGKKSTAAGFEARDSRGDIYILKFDPPANPQMTTAAEVITPRFLYAAGYNVPENYLVNVDPSDFTVDPEATMRGKYRVRRRMTEADVEHALETVVRQPNGTLRAVAIKFLPGIPKGPFLYEGTRPDDINDRIRHENRRELRGLRVVAAFLNHTDPKAANAVDMYDPHTRYLTHYLVDFSSTLGADNINQQLPRYGNEYFLDFGTIGRSTVSFGAYVKPWEVPFNVEYPSAGYFNVAYFDPERWRPTFPNPAFKRMTLRDAYWGAKLVTSFTDEDIETIVRTGEFSDPRAERHVADVLKGRRDKIGRYYFNKINPLDRFKLTEQGEIHTLGFENLALSGGYAPSATASYRYRISAAGKTVSEAVVQAPRIPLRRELMGASAAQPCIVMIETSYDGGERWSKRVFVYIRYESGAGRFNIVGIDRET